MKHEVQKLVAARVSLMFNARFYGDLATRMVLVEAPIPRWRCDGDSFLYNKEWVNAASPDELEGAFCDAVREQMASPTPHMVAAINRAFQAAQDKALR